MGGYAAFAFYRRYAKRVAALILADTRAAADTPEGIKGRYELAGVAEHQGSDAVAERLLTRLFAPITPDRQPAVVAAAREMIRTASPAGIARALRGMAARPDSTSLLRKINCPTLVIVGAEDVLTPPAESEAIAAAIAGARLEIVPQAGHLANLERPFAVNALLADFLAR